MRGWSALAVASMLAAAPAFADGLTVRDAWSRTTPPGISMGVIYLTITNGSKKSDRLLKLRASVGTSAEVHRTEVIEGIARMRAVSVLHVAPGETVKLEPGGLHVMLTGLEEPLVEGQVFQLDLLFEVAGPRKVEVTVRKP